MVIAGTQAGDLRYLQNVRPSGGFIPNSITVLAYPNPISKFLCTSVPDDCKAACFNTIGPTVTLEIYVSANQKTPLDLSNLSNGLYVLRLSR